MLCLLLAAAVLVFLADIATGPAWYGLDDVLKTVLMPADAQAQMRVVIWSIRMPSALMAVVVEMALATAGVQMQTVLNNPLASPFTLGISSAASFGAALALAFGLSFIPVAGVRRLRLETLVLISLLSSIPAAFVGTIGFVGLVAPHIARMLVGEDHRRLLPASAMIGALIMSSSSTVAKVLVPGAVLPIGVITAVTGLPVFFYLILKGGRETW
ncbi:FecCD transport family protein [Rhizobium azibense]|uniref:FecCD transport family protein n=2 Tax=Rhizobium azibense TaxID=1136135 RepID=A0A4R3R7Y9_9HYPH|nr:iron chelate uptake ABC transporter family permease subunit [Rhizobium azibense]TCU30831.1 FecCD transport family protein [Rhizobium azibense]